MLIFGLNLSSRRKKRFPGIDDVIVARPCHWSTSADRFVDMTLKEVLLDKKCPTYWRWNLAINNASILEGFSTNAI